MREIYYKFLSELSLVSLNGHKVGIKDGFCFLLSESLYNCLRIRKFSDSIIKNIMPELILLERLNFLPLQFVGVQWKNFKTIALNLTTDCNLSCSYCYDKPHQKKVGIQYMKISTAKSAIDFLVNNTISNDLEIIFLGGEPLLNWYCFTQAVDYTKNFDLKWHIILLTNGTLIDKSKAKFLSENNVYVCQSFSPKKLQNKYRLFTNGDLSYELAKKGLNNLISNGVNFYIKTIIPKYEKIEIEEVGKELRKDVPSFIPCHINYEDQTLIGSFKRNKKNFIAKLKKRIEAEQYSVGLIPYIHRILSPSLIGHPFCIGGISGYYIDADGTVTICQYSLGYKEFHLGSVDRFDYEKAKDIFLKFSTYHSECQLCWAKSLCSYCNLRKFFKGPYELFC
ncbi:MAG: radical SAM protein [Candidatus Omnitrophota bacterium]